ncbi:hypothetical protein Pcinc_013142 [Petrolisthes cinctipes]|uniref:Secreted protein n=1 Tax=Petrolisthes cinctipes TaxID=88211 RepID=A0AAE1G0C6_PETCI|nr:hypothetical protein Pcinc_013142 [Petrolisthes cinctipes]
MWVLMLVMMMVGAAAVSGERQSSGGGVVERTLIVNTEASQIHPHYTSPTLETRPILNSAISISAHEACTPSLHVHTHRHSALLFHQGNTNVSYPPRRKCQFYPQNAPLGLLHQGNTNVSYPPRRKCPFYPQNTSLGLLHQGHTNVNCSPRRAPSFCPNSSRTRTSTTSSHQLYDTSSSYRPPIVECLARTRFNPEAGWNVAILLPQRRPLQPVVQHLVSVPGTRHLCIQQPDHQLPSRSATTSANC